MSTNLPPDVVLLRMTEDQLNSIPDKRRERIKARIDHLLSQATITRPRKTKELAEYEKTHPAEDLPTDTKTHARILADLATPDPGENSRTRSLARNGVKDLSGASSLQQRKKDAAQYLAGIALMWDRDRILIETGWSLQRLAAVERFVRQEERRIHKSRDTYVVWTEYRLQQLQCAKELEDMAEIFRSTKQHNAVVTALKARSDIVERIVKMGQELGVIDRAAKKVEVESHSTIDVQSMSVSEIRVHIKEQMSELKKLIEIPSGPTHGPASIFLQKALPAASE